MGNKLLVIVSVIIFVGILVFVKPESYADIELTKKEIHEIEVMEGRLFQNDIDGESNIYRIERLEKELLFSTYPNDTIKERLQRLKLASQKQALTGAAMPVGMGRRYSRQKITNYDLPQYDSVGLVDGMIRAFYPDFYETLRQKQGKLLKNNDNPDGMFR